MFFTFKHKGHSFYENIINYFHSINKQLPSYKTILKFVNYTLIFKLNELSSLIKLFYHSILSLLNTRVTVFMQTLSIIFWALPNNYWYCTVSTTQYFLEQVPIWTLYYIILIKNNTKSYQLYTNFSTVLIGQSYKTFLFYFWVIS